MTELVGDAKRQLIVLAYCISDGALEFLNLLRERLRAGVQVTIIVNSLETHHGKAAVTLLKMARDYGDQFALYEFRGQRGNELHAKAVIVDETVALVGSANLSWSGLVSNYELAVILEGDQVAEIATTARKLLKAPEVIRVEA